MIGFWKENEKYGGFSNWKEAEFDFEGHHFYNSEQAFMYKKAELFKDNEMMKEILGTSDPKACKSLGRLVKGFDSSIFNQNKYQFMVDVNYAKFSQNEVLKELLLNTKDEYLVEASPLDVIWGCGLSVNSPKFNNPSEWRGQNLLGKALMEVRNKIKEK